MISIGSSRGSRASGKTIWVVADLMAAWDRRFNSSRGNRDSDKILGAAELVAVGVAVIVVL